MTQTKTNTEDAAQAVTEAMAKLQKMGFQSMHWMGSDWVEQMTDLGNEALQFMAERVEKDVELQHRLMQCTDMGELHKIQAEFIQSAIDRYTEETGRLIEMSTKFWTLPAGARR